MLRQILYRTDGQCPHIFRGTEIFLTINLSKMKAYTILLTIALIAIVAVTLIGEASQTDQAL